MKIECTIKRPGGTKADIGGTEYHFKPVDDSPLAAHVAEVTNERHIARFLEISESYRPADGETAPASRMPASPAKPARNPDVPLGSKNFDSVIQINGQGVDLSEIVTAAFVASGLDVEAWNALEAGDRDIKIQVTIEALQKGSDGGDFESMTWDQLKEAAGKYGISKNIPKAEMIAALKALPR